MPASPPLSRRRGALAVVVGCAAFAALSLLVADEPTYDPTAWLIWGREILHGDLDTVAGPSWKPLPVLLTTPFAALGDGVAPALWLLVARTGGLLALVMAFRLGRRLGGPPAGVVAAGGLLIANQFVSNFARGDSEGLLVAAALWTIELWLDGRRRAAFAACTAAALMRPEVWPFLALLGADLVRVRWRTGPPWRTIAAVAAAGALVLALWFVPEELGSGNLLRAASRAREPVPDSPAQAAVPFLAVFSHSVKALSWPVYAGGVVAVLAAVRDRRDGGGRRRLLIAAVATVLMLEVAALAQGGFTGNLRYVTLPAALVCVLAGPGWTAAARAVRTWRPGAGRAVAIGVVLVFAAALVVHPVRTAADQTADVVDESRLLGELPGVIDGAGGRDAVLACGAVVTGPFQTQSLAWELRVHQARIGIRARRPGIAFRAAGTRLRGFERLPRRFSQGSWTVRASCPPGP